MKHILILVALIAVVAALPADPVIYKLDEERFQYLTDDDGIPRLVDLWVKASDLKASARFTPDTQNIYHLFTRSNPTRSQVIIFNDESSLVESHFDASKRNAVIIHGWTNSATSPINTILVPAFLAAEDMNVFVVDWHGGAGTINYPEAAINTVTSGESVARFIRWVNSVTGASLSSYHIVGHSLGGHQAGIVGRNLDGEVPYITSLDPALPGWISNRNRFRQTDGIYTEVIHTNVGVAGYMTALGHVDFYPNGGINMPGCSSQNCDHNRAYYYLGDSLGSTFTGTRCESLSAALSSNCNLPETLKMGGVTPKTGKTGLYYVATNASPPFSQG